MSIRDEKYSIIRFPKKENKYNKKQKVINNRDYDSRFDKLENENKILMQNQKKIQEEIEVLLSIIDKFKIHIVDHENSKKYHKTEQNIIKDDIKENLPDKTSEKERIKHKCAECMEFIDGKEFYIKMKKYYHNSC